MAFLDNPYGDNDGANVAPERTDLVEYVMNHVRNGRHDRDQKHEMRWKEYTRLWRGFFSEEDKNSDSERSQIIAPALQQAVDMTVSEIEETVFGREAWFDITDDIADENKDDAIAYRDQFLEDARLDGVADGIMQAVLLGAIYGTGIAKLNMMEKEEKYLEEGKMRVNMRISVPWEPVRPDQFVIDPSALDVESALYVAHEMIKPMHSVEEKQLEGLYLDADLHPWTGNRPDTEGTGRTSIVRATDEGVLITEFFGKVPENLIDEESDSDELIEALVVIANEAELLRAIRNPFVMQDRPFVAYPHERVPGEFWGRGVCEKGYNPQKALDAELRARIDTLALLTAPMMGADITRLPRSPDMRVRPGKTLFTRGRPSEIYEPIAFGNPAILSHTFQHSGDLERMVQMGTGAMDSATPVGVNARNETASGLGQLQAGFIKRAKRTMQNIERLFLNVGIRKALWRYMQFDPQRYPVDMKFAVNSIMGIMAKEVETTQLTSVLGYLAPEDPARKVIVQAIFENTASSQKAKLKQAIEEMTKPPDEEQMAMQKKAQQLNMADAEASVMLKRAQAAKEEGLANMHNAQAELNKAKAYHEGIDAELADDLVEIQAANAVTGAQKVREQEKATLVNAAKVSVDKRKVEKVQGGPAPQ